MREMLLGAAAKGAFEPVWSERILEEWARAARRLPGGAEAIARAEIEAMRDRWPEASHDPGIEAIEAISLPDADDRHVAATAVMAGADTILTLNRRDFPSRILSRQGIFVRDPDGFLVEIHVGGEDLSPVLTRVVARAEAIAGEARSPRGLLKRAGLPRLGKLLGAG